MPTTAKEDYLKALYFLDRENSRISMTDLSNKLAVSKPTANNMIKNLEEHGWVIYRKYQPVELTEAGRKMAALIIRKHRLTEMFLHEVMGFGWEEVHEIAEQIEHIHSEKLFTRMDEMLNYPASDPHGSPIPDKQGNIPEQQYQTLVDVPVGGKVRLCALGASSANLLHYLNRNQIQLGTSIEILKIEPFDHSLLISCDDKTPLMISRKVGESLLVE
ncbi:MAG: metal-dependent transcriptional regulator [Lewinella sp.]|nr:metal-dependent transcriptional regulator [Lewinella sp.]